MWEDFGNTGPSVVLFLDLIVILLFRQCIMPAVQDTEAGNSNRSEGSLTSGILDAIANNNQRTKWL